MAVDGEIADLVVQEKLRRTRQLKPLFQPAFCGALPSAVISALTLTNRVRMPCRSPNTSLRVGDQNPQTRTGMDWYLPSEALHGYVSIKDRIVANVVTINRPEVVAL